MTLAAHAQPSLLRSGPMVGYVAPKAARFWLQTTRPATAWLVVTDAAGRTRRTESVQTVPADSLIGHMQLDSLAPAQPYRCQLWLDGRPVALPRELTFRTPPVPGTPADFTFVTGSCAYVAEPYELTNPIYGIFRRMAQEPADLMLWLGDNAYLNAGEAATVPKRRHRFGHSRALPALQPLLGGMSNVAIWDDHDFGQNDADRTTVNVPEAQQTFELFWVNPPLAQPGAGDISTKLTWGDADFFLLDNRSHRDPEHGPLPRAQFGPAQLRWLLRELRASRATFKFVVAGGQVLNGTRTGESWAHHYNRERRALLDSLAAYRVPNVVFLTGDRHYSELTRRRWRRHAPAWLDLTVSPFTSGPVRHGTRNGYRQRGTLVRERNYATLRLSGPAGARRLTISVRGTDGQLYWERTMAAE